MTATWRRVWRCITCKDEIAGPYSPCGKPACLAEAIAQEARWKRYEDD